MTKLGTLTKLRALPYYKANKVCIFQDLNPAASTYTPNTMNIYYLISIEYLLFNKYCIINDKTKLKSFKLKNLLLKR